MTFFGRKWLRTLWSDQMAAPLLPCGAPEKLDPRVLSIFWLVVEPTHLKNITQNGDLPQVGVKIKNIPNHHLVFQISSREFWNPEISRVTETPRIQKLRVYCQALSDFEKKCLDPRTMPKVMFQHPPPNKTGGIEWSLTHRIHGTGICIPTFTLNLWCSCTLRSIYVPIPWIIWVI